MGHNLGGAYISLVCIHLYVKEVRVSAELSSLDFSKEYSHVRFLMEQVLAPEA